MNDIDVPDSKHRTGSVSKAIMSRTQTVYHITLVYLTYQIDCCGQQFDGQTCWLTFNLTCISHHSVTAGTHLTTIASLSIATMQPLRTHVSLAIHFIQQQRTKRPLISRDKIQYDARAISMCIQCIHSYLHIHITHTCIYTVFQKKGRHQTHGRNSVIS